MKNRLIYIGLGSVMTLVLTVTTITFANNSGDINACVHKTNGTVRIIDGEGVKDCSKNEIPLSWNAEGEQGPEGPMGPQGEQGPEGPQGEPGESNWDEDRITALEQRVLALEEGGGGDDVDGPYETTITFSLSNNSPDPTSLIVEPDDNSDWFNIFVFDIEAGEGGLVTVDELAIRLDTEGESYLNILDDARISIEGNIYDDYYVNEIDFDTVMLVFEFEPAGFVIEAGESTEIELLVELESYEDNYLLGQTIQASVRASDASYWSAEGYDDLPPSDFFGEAIGGLHELNLETEEPEEEE